MGEPMKYTGDLAGIVVYPGCKGGHMHLLTGGILVLQVHVNTDEEIKLLNDYAEDKGATGQRLYRGPPNPIEIEVVDGVLKGWHSIPPPPPPPKEVGSGLEAWAGPDRSPEAVRIRKANLGGGLVLGFLLLVLLVALPNGGATVAERVWNGLLHVPVLLGLGYVGGYWFRAPSNPFPEPADKLRYVWRTAFGFEITNLRGLTFASPKWLLSLGFRRP